MQIIYIDLDDVLYPLSKHIVDVVNEKTGHNYDYKENTDYWWDSHPAGADYFRKTIYEEGIFIDGGCMLDGIYYIQKLMDEGYEIRFLTYPIWNSKYCVAEKVKFLKQCFPLLDIDTTLCMYKNKYELANSERILLDDSVDNCKEWIKHGGKAYVLKNHYNSRLIGDLPYVNSHEEFYNIIRRR